jgi:ATP-dependent Clp protease ATP-binding subunit ClpA
MFSTRERFGLRQMYQSATSEARRRGDRRVGTEHLVLALVQDPGSDTARALGVSLEQARAGLHELDRQALASLGITLGITVQSDSPIPPGRADHRLRLTPAAKGVLIGLRNAPKAEKVGLRHVLLRLLEQDRPDPAAELLTVLGVDPVQVRHGLQGLDQ